MGFITGNEHEKSQLAKEIYEISRRAVSSCVHLHQIHKNRPQFIDWYLVLKVSENAELDSIRKQYRKLALQLHPDKNKHSKAETAFKLVSEAYFCLSNNERRADFDSERNSNSCSQCNNTTSHRTSTHVKIKTPPRDSSRFHRIQRRFKDLRTKLKEETRIIDKCLVTNVRERESGNATEIPVFNPSDYDYKGYPHHRTINHKKLESLRSLFMSENKKVHSFGKNESPIFQCRSEKVSFMNKSGSMRGL